MKHQKRSILGTARSLFFLIPVLLAASPASAQRTTADLQGVVRDASGPMSGVTVTATNTESGVTRSTVTGVDGLYSLILPPGPYIVTAGTAAHEEQKTTVRLQVGQTIEFNFDLKPGAVTAAVSVSADVAPEVELRTSEVATNVSQDQIKNLPQATRNFLNFAALAPGVRLSHDELRQEISYGAQGATNTNVFIDGASYKNDILLGGAVGQDSSRGNPFPQNAVQEFRVITQNYKAEYQKASSVIISAVTKSGTNDLHGDVFVYYQNKSLVSQDAFSEARGGPKPEYTRWQPGLSLGGPIVKDKVYIFGSYEGNYQNREPRSSSAETRTGPPRSATRSCRTPGSSRAPSAPLFFSERCRPTQAPARRWTSPATCVTRPTSAISATRAASSRPIT